MVDIFLVFLVGGMITFLAGHFWEETAHLAHMLFGTELKEHLAKKVMVVGAIWFLATLGIGYLFVR